MNIENVLTLNIPSGHGRLFAASCKEFRNVAIICASRYDAREGNPPDQLHDDTLTPILAIPFESVPQVKAWASFFGKLVERMKKDETSET